MSKELTPLEALKDLFANPYYIELGRIQGKKRFNRDIQIIEKALKENAELKQMIRNFNEAIGEPQVISPTVEKEHEALEIIKETCEFDFIKEEIINKPTRYKIHIRRKGENNFNMYYTVLVLYPKSQEEFDLLKEVLK